MLCCERGDDMYRMTEMALKWDKIRVELVSHLYEMKIHLGKIYFYRDFSDYIRGWKITCMKGFEEVPRMKHNNKFPTFEKLYECLWEEREDVFNVKRIVEDIEYFCEELIYPLIMFNNAVLRIIADENRNEYSITAEFIGLNKDPLSLECIDELGLSIVKAYSSSLNSSCINGIWQINAII